MSVEGATVLETNYHMNTYDNIQSASTIGLSETDGSGSAVPYEQIKEGDWDFEFTNFVGAHADVIVECPWQPGAEMTLSTVTLEWPAPIRKENVDSVFAQLRQLVANKMQKQEETAEDNLETKPDLTIAEDQQAPETITKPENRPMLTASKVKELKKTVIKPESEQQILITNTTSLQPPAPAPPAPEIILDNNVYSAPFEYISATVAEVPLPAPDLIKSNAEIPEVAIRLNTDTQAPIIELTNFAPKKDIPKQPEPATVLAVTQETETSITLSDPLEAPIITAEEIYHDEVATELPKLAVVDIVENVTPINETITAYDFAQVDEVLLEIAEAVEEKGVEVAKKTHEIILEIIEVSAEVKTSDIIDVDLTQETIEELFIDLLETLGIDYTPELIETLAQLTFNGNFALILDNLSSVDEEETPIKSGARKIIQQLVVILAKIKVSIEQASNIGKSALRHYGLSLVPSKL